MSITRNLSKAQARIEALAVLGIIDGYILELDRLYPDFQKKFAKTMLGKIELGIKGISPIIMQKEVDVIVNLISEVIIEARPRINHKLNQFWDAHLEIAGISQTTGMSYEPMSFVNQNREEILKIADKYNSVSMRFLTNTNDEIILFALFYIHILKVDVIEYSFVKQFRDLLEQYNLQTKYDPEDIFSAEHKISKHTRWKTDGRAIRDCLAHNKFKLIFLEDSWKISFKNNDEGYNFERTLSKNQLLQIFVDLDFLYRSSLMLVFTLILSTLTKQHFVIESI